MWKRGLSHEGLKFIACMAMLLDHIGIIMHLRWLRIIGRLAFPIYCFLLVEGARHTRSPGKYALRLLICGLLSEIPFDLFCRQGWGSQNVMFTLLLGFGMLYAAERSGNWPEKIAAAVICACLAELLQVDYGAAGILIIAVFAWVDEIWLQAGLMLIVSVLYGGRIQSFAVFSILPILLYSGEKRTGSRAVQWGFYLFYPVHMLLLYFVRYI